MANSEHFDLQQVADADVRKAVMFSTEKVNGLLCRAAAARVEIGVELNNVKRLLPHGLFCDWLQAEFAWSRQTAGNFMRAGELLGNVKNLDKLQWSAAMLLCKSDTPQDAIDDIIKRVESGKYVNMTTAEDVIESYRPRIAEPKEAEVMAPFRESAIVPESSKTNRNESPKITEIVATDDEADDYNPDDEDTHPQPIRRGSGSNNEMSEMLTSLENFIERIPEGMEGFFWQQATELLDRIRP